MIIQRRRLICRAFDLIFSDISSSLPAEREGGGFRYSPSPADAHDEGGGSDLVVETSWGWEKEMAGHEGGLLKVTDFIRKSLGFKVYKCRTRYLLRHIVIKKAGQPTSAVPICVPGIRITESRDDLTP